MTGLSIVLGEWMDGCVDGWMDVKAVLRIAYSNKKHCLVNQELNVDKGSFIN